MKIRLRLLGRMRMLAGGPEMDVEVDAGATVGDVLNELGRRIPKVSEITPVYAVMRSEEIVGQDVAVKEGDRLTLLPPVGGG